MGDVLCLFSLSVFCLGGCVFLGKLRLRWGEKRARDRRTPFLEGEPLARRWPRNVILPKKARKRVALIHSLFHTQVTQPTFRVNRFRKWGFFYRTRTERPTGCSIIQRNKNDDKTSDMCFFSWLRSCIQYLRCGNFTIHTYRILQRRFFLRGELWDLAFELCLKRATFLGNGERGKAYLFETLFKHPS